MHGQGTIRLPDGSKYTGGFMDGKKAGDGRITDKEGITIVVEFKDDVVIRNKTP